MESGSTGRQIIFRNYTPISESLRTAAPVTKVAPVDALALAEQLALSAVEEAPHVAETEQEAEEHTDKALRKPDWDLKREIQDKLDILDSQTQYALSKLIKQKLVQS